MLRFDTMIAAKLSSAVVLVAVVLSSGSAAAQGGNAAEGRRLAGSVCSACHVIQEGQRGPAMDAAPTFVTMANDPAMTNERLRRFLNRPHSQMPPIQISRGEIEDLIAYIRTLKRPAR